MNINRPLKFLLVLFLLVYGGIQVNSQSLNVPANFTVTSTVNSPQILRSIVTDTDPYTGRQVYVWGEADAGSTTTNIRDIYCAIYDKDQNVLVSSFKVNTTTTTGDQSLQRVRINPYDGSFVITWASTAAGNWDSFARKISLNITPAQSQALNAQTLPIASGEIAVNTNATLKSGTQYYPMPVFCDISGELLIAFTGTGSNATLEVFYQRFNYADMSLIGVEQQLNTTVTNNQSINSFEYSTVSNQIIACYHSNATGNYDIMRRVISYSETTGVYSADTETTINTTLTGDQQNGWVAINQNTGTYSISWQTPTSWKVYAKIFNTAHAMVKDEFSVLGTETSDNEAGGKSVWDESSNVLLFFWDYFAGSFTNNWYSMFDGNTLTYITGSETLINTGSNTNTLGTYGTNFYPGYNKRSHKVTLAYDVLTGSGGSVGYVAAFTYAHPSFNPAVSTNDATMNWTDTKVFNGYGDVTAESRTYFDNFGKQLQSQVFNPEDKTIFAQMPLYDYLDRPAIQSMPGLVTNSSTSFKYDSLFFPVSQSGTNVPYRASYWDQTNALTPSPLSNTYGLGQYYSGTNVTETGVGQTGYPYSRTVFNDAVPGGAIKQSAPGDSLRMGKGRETKTITLSVLNELDHYLSVRNANFWSPGMQQPPTFSGKATKTIDTDANGITAITFTTQDGLTVATAHEGTSTQQTMYADLMPNIYSLYTTVSDGTNIASHFQIIGNDDILVFDAATGNQIYPTGSSAIPGPISGFDLNDMFAAYPSLANIQIRSRENFHLKYLFGVPNPTAAQIFYNNLGTWHTNDAAVFQNGQSGIDLHLQANHGLALSCSTPNIQIQVTDLSSGSIVYTGTVAGFSASALKGYYRFIYNSSNMPYSTTYSDAAHNIHFSFTSSYQEYAYFFYDDAGRLIAKTAPNGVNLASTAYPAFTDTYMYNSAGQLISMTETDGGTTGYVYLLDGRLRFSQNADQAVTGKFSFINYDNENRVVKSGEYDKTVSGATLVFQTLYQNYVAGIYGYNYTTDTYSPAGNVLAILDTTRNNGGLGSDTYLSDFNTVAYSSTTAYPLTDINNNSIGSRTPRNVWNEVSQTTNKAGYSTQYSYDNDGRLEWMAETLPGLGSKTVDYVYDQSNQLLQTIYQKNQSADRFDHVYTYDRIGRLKTSWTRESTGVMKLQEKNYYYLHGPLKRRELAGNLQGIDYVYTVQGWLKGINHPELNTAKDPGKDGASGTANAGFAPDVFGMGLEYYSGDYSNTSIVYATPTGVDMYSAGLNSLFNSLHGNLFNGSIRTMSWLSSKSQTTNPNQYNYNYDNKYQLTAAEFGSQVLSNNNTFVPDAADKYMTMVTYDLNGNLQSKYSWKTATPEGYAYTYTSNTNKLASLSGSATRTYNYNAIGQMIQQTESGGTGRKVYYTPSGLTSYITDLSATPKMLVKYEYNERGERVKKINYNPTTGAIAYTTWYVNDASGNTLSIYDNNNTTVLQKEIPVYGSGRIGVCYKSSTYSYAYELKDHLGNVRVTVDRNKVSGAGHILNWSDYLPFGEVMPGADHQGVTTPIDRYGYQGDYAEFDGETSWNSFDLRMYDANIGRWLSKDPYGQYWSPYTGMGNDPVNSIDPTGGATEDWYQNKQTGGVTWFKGSGERAGYDHLGGWGLGIRNAEWEDPGIGDLLNRGKHLDDFYEQSGGNFFPTDNRQTIVFAYQWKSVADLYSVYGYTAASGRADFDASTSLAVAGVLTSGLRLVGGALMRNAAAKTGIQTANGIKITGFAKHGLNRAIERGVKPNAILDAVKNPLKTGNVVTDKLGRQSQRFVGRSSEVVLNPQTGKVISVNPTSSSKAAKLLNQLGQ